MQKARTFLAGLSGVNSLYRLILCEGGRSMAVWRLRVFRGRPAAAAVGLDGGALVGASCWPRSAMTGLCGFLLTCGTR